MKKADWLFSIAFILMGLGCLSMSVIYVSSPGVLNDYISTAVKWCLWFGIPVIVAVIVYIFMKKRGEFEK